jgi:molybdopterin/thiamine biosynthesis adenylyltransferase
MITWVVCTPHISFSFWTALREQKINIWRLDTSPKHIFGFLTFSPKSCIAHVRDDSFHATPTPNHNEYVLKGHLRVFNTKDELLEFNSTFTSIDDDFIVGVYPNLKTNVFTYVLGFRKPQGTIPILDFKHSDALASFMFPIFHSGTEYRLPSICSRYIESDTSYVFSNAHEVRFGDWTNRQCGLEWTPVQRVDIDTALRGMGDTDYAARLNLELMRWRMLPELNLDRIAGQRVLFLGAGTLGTHFARNLLAWGVRHITFVDNGRVSYSNPVRQPLFDYSDAEYGRWKAEAAAEALRRIHPSVRAEGHVLDIPMPGHPLRADLCDAAVTKLHELIDAHDIICMLTDNRESRWLPTLLTRYLGKVGITVALGFDSWLVVRHGPPLGCYFCMDCVVPQNTTQNRTLDQQCTVSRPGIAPIAASIAGELLIALLHHPDGVSAAHEYTADISATTRSPLGVVPHILRGFISHFQTLVTQEPASKYCSACSTAICDQYKKEGSLFISRICNDPNVLSNLTCVNEIIDADVDID